MLWKTLDASLGKAFDKVAKILGLSYPGGPLIGELAKKGDGMRLKLPGAMIKRSGCKFPFSGIKTEVKNLAREFVMSKCVLRFKSVLATYYSIESEML